MVAVGELSRGLMQGPGALVRSLHFILDGRSLGVLKRTSSWTLAPLWRINPRRAQVAKRTMEEIEPQTGAESGLDLEVATVEVELEKKNKSNFLDSEMLSHADPGGRA